MKHVVSFVLVLVVTLAFGLMFVPQSVFALPTLNLSQSTGFVGTVVSATGSGYAGISCTSFTSSPSGLFVSSSCLVSGGALSASFTVGPSASVGTTYSVTVTTSLDIASTGFTVIAPPPSTFFLSLTSGLPGTTVTVSGSNYLGTTCSLSSNPSGLFSGAPPPTCSTVGGTLAGGFKVATGAPSGSYTVTVTTNVPSDTNSVPFIVPTPTFVLNPPSGFAGMFVSVSGTHYAASSSCSVSSNPLGLFSIIPACSISGSGTLTGASFTVSPSAAIGGYTVTVNTDVDTKSASFTVVPLTVVTATTTTTATTTITTTTVVTVTTTPAPSLFLNPVKGRQGQMVLFSGSGFASVDTTCTISSDATLITAPTCTVSTGSLSGQFTVDNSAPTGSYMVTATGSSHDRGSALFTVLPPATLSLSQYTGLAGVSVTVSGSNFLGTTCLLSSNPTNLFPPQSCNINTGTGVLSGLFTVQSSAVFYIPYAVTAQSNVESASVTFTVLPPTTAVYYTTTATTPYYTATATTPLYTTTATGMYYTTTATTPYYTATALATYYTTTTSTISVQSPFYTATTTIAVQATQFNYVTLTNTISTGKTVPVLTTITIPSMTGVIYTTQTERTTETDVTTRTSTTNVTIPVFPTTTAGAGPFNLGSDMAYTLGAIAVVGVLAVVGFLRFVYPRLRPKPKLTAAETAEAEAAAQAQPVAGEAEALARQAAQIPSVTGPTPPLPAEAPAEAQATYAFCTTCGAPRDPTATKCRSCGREYETAIQESPEVAEETSFKAQQAIDKQERETAQVEEGPE